MSSEPSDFDLGAAWLRRAQGDLTAFMEGLAVRLQSALPGRVVVERRREGLFSRQSHVGRIAVTITGCTLILDHDRGRLQARRAKVVRDVTISSEEIGVEAWLDELIRETRDVGDAAGRAHAVLHDFLMS